MIALCVSVRPDDAVAENTDPVTGAVFNDENDPRAGADPGAAGGFNKGTGAAVPTACPLLVGA